MPDAADLEEDGRSILAGTAHLQQDLELSASDHEAAQAVASASATPRPTTPAAPATGTGARSPGGQTPGASNPCPQLRRPSLSTLATWPRTGNTISTIQQARAAISYFHATAGMDKTENPSRHPAVAEAVRDGATEPRTRGDKTPLVTNKTPQIQQPGIARVFAIMAEKKAPQRRSSAPVGHM